MGIENIKTPFASDQERMEAENRIIEAQDSLMTRFPDAKDGIRILIDILKANRRPLPVEPLADLSIAE